MNIIVAVDQNWGIGRENQLLMPIPEDLKQLRAKTLHNVVVMGRTTLDSLPGGRPLADRTNVVLSRDPDYAPEGVTVCHSLEALEETLAAWPADKVFLLGGASVYRQLLDECECAYVTKIQAAFPADAHFPDLDARENWEAGERSDLREYNGVTFYYQAYHNNERQD